MERRDGMHFVGAANRLRAGLGKTQVAHLPRADEFGHRANCFFDGCVRIHAMLVVEVDRVNAEAAETCFARRADVFRPAVDAAEVGVAGAEDSELRGEEHFVAPTANGAANELFVDVRAVDVRGVKEIDAQLERAMDRGNGFRVVPSAVKLRHAHATQPEGGYERSILAKTAFLHEILPNEDSLVGCCGRRRGYIGSGATDFLSV